MMKSLFLLLAVLLAALPGRAQLGPEIARKHAERAGEKLAALKSLRAEGKTFIGREVVPFTMVAARPNRLRVETFTPLRQVVQVYDGQNPPWISHSQTSAGAPQDMGPADAKDFTANADFDGPLVDCTAKGYSVDYAGEDRIDGRRAFKLLMMSRSDDIFFLWVDAETYEVVKRSVYRTNKDQRVSVETLFKDFREVGGVLQPHRIETTANGRMLYVMIVDKMTANVDAPPELFARPAAGGSAP